MRPNRHMILKFLSDNRSELSNQYGVQRIGLFGSYSRGQQSKKSDVDILVSFNRDIDLFDFIDLKEHLERHLGVTVDLVMETALKPSIGKQILSEVDYATQAE